MNKTKKSLITGLVSACFVFLGGLGMSANTTHAVTGEPDPSATKLTITNKTGKLDVLKYSGDTPDGNNYIKYHGKKYTRFEYGNWGRNVYVYTDDLKSNHGHISYLYDEVVVYPRFDNGLSQYNNEVNKLNYSDKYNMVVNTSVSNLNEKNNYTFLNGNFGEPSWTVSEEIEFESGTLNGIGVEMPVHFVNYYPTRKVTIKAKKNKKVRTYTSTGKFSKKYVYGKHNYKVTSYKKIKNHGTCYKLSGKNQYIPKKYLKFR